MGMVERLDVGQGAADDFRSVLAPLGGFGGGGEDESGGGDGSRGRQGVLKVKT